MKKRGCLLKAVEIFGSGEFGPDRRRLLRDFHLQGYLRQWTYSSRYHRNKVRITRGKLIGLWELYISWRHEWGLLISATSATTAEGRL